MGSGWTPEPTWCSHWQTNRETPESASYIHRAPPGFVTNLFVTERPAKWMDIDVLLRFTSLGLSLLYIAIIAPQNCHTGMKSSGTSSGELNGRPALSVVSFCQLEEDVAVAAECMSASSTHEVTSLLRAWCEGDPKALEKLVPLVYRELHQAAHHQMVRERSGHTLETTGLVNEVYLRLIGLQKVSWQNRAHFLAVCAKLMRRILTDYARTRRRLKRGGGGPDLSFDSNLIIFGAPRVDLLALDDALTNLATFDQRKSKVVELRFFGGLTAEETAEALGVSTETVLRDWKVAKVWLLHELSVEQRYGA